MPPLHCSINHKTMLAMRELTFDQLPKAVVQLFDKLEGIEQLLLERQTPPPPADDFLSLKEAADFLSIAPQTMYQNVKRIPHHKRFGKLYFKRSELVAYLEAGTKNQ